MRRDLLLHPRWPLVRLRDLVALDNLKDDQREEGDREEQRQARAEAERDKDDVEDLGELLVNDELGAGLHLHVGIHLAPSPAALEHFWPRLVAIVAGFLAHPFATFEASLVLVAA